MGSMTEFSPSVRVFLTAYRWRRLDPVPWAPLETPLAASRVALVSSAGFWTSGQPPFDSEQRGGDASFRIVERDIDIRELHENHRSDSFDHTPMNEDPNIAFPIDRIRELADEGFVGEVAPRHLSFMGSITAPGRLVRDTAPEAARWLVEDGVDAALLVPV